MCRQSGLITVLFLLLVLTISSPVNFIAHSLNDATTDHDQRGVGPTPISSHRLVLGEEKKRSRKAMQLFLPAEYTSLVQSPLPFNAIVVGIAEGGENVKDPSIERDWQEAWHPVVHEALARREVSREIAVVMVGECRTIQNQLTQTRLRENMFQPMLEAEFQGTLFAALKPRASITCASTYGRKVLKRRNFTVAECKASKWPCFEDGTTLSVDEILAALQNVTEKVYLELVPLSCCAAMVQNLECYDRLDELGESHVSQFYPLKQAYEMLLKHEFLHGKFEYIIKVRSDAGPIYKINFHGSLPSNYVCAFGDGQAMLPRHFGDIYFTLYRTFLDCESRLNFSGVKCKPDVKGQRVNWDCLSFLHLERYGVQHRMCKEINFIFWFDRAWPFDECAWPGARSKKVPQNV
ncbi:hypothetical protein CYMTET_11469 [Cymbomonas tetramitiformis]|uniref:Uncharacterized protein n=1 Tax=Cymbomonas tetramitiformis TaxID=36881 RepID=A0AAE0LDG3_9CHLO|nr:hypothetical protein CYMTET_11469 [Cymbomonas tetramitiformis]